MILPHSGELFRLALGMGYDHVYAERLVHVTLIAGGDNLNEFTSPGGAKLWLFKIMIRFPVEALGREHQEREVDHDLASLPSGPDASPLCHADPLLSKALRSLQHLHEEQRLILLLSILPKFDCEQIGVILQLSNTIVLRELSRALLQFQACLVSEQLELKPESAPKEECQLNR